jgi:ferredoxin
VHHLRRTSRRRGREGEWDQFASRRFYPEDREGGFILLCTARPLSDLVVRTHQHEAMRDHRLDRGLPTPGG